MALYEPSSHWWSDVFQTEFRLVQKRDLGDSLSPPQYPRIRFGLISGPQRMTKAIIASVRGFLGHQPRNEPSVSCTDPVEAYLHACIAATFFCYVSPELYGLTDITDEQHFSLKGRHRSGDDL